MVIETLVYDNETKIFICTYETSVHGIDFINRYKCNNPLNCI